MADDLKAPKGYAVLTADDYFVGIWRDRETAEKIVNRSPMSKGERIVEYTPAALAAARAQQPGDWRLPGKHINDIQQQSIAALVKRCKQAHFVDVRVRINGADEFYEADWIKHMHAAPPAPDAEDAARLAALERLASEMVSINAPGSHGGSADKWLVTVERRGGDSFGPLCDEYEADTFRAAIDAARESEHVR